MYEPLVPCSGCRRHVRAADGACPFCATAITSAVRADVRTRLSRGALFAAASVAISVAGCSSDDTGTTPIVDSGVDTGTAVTDSGSSSDGSVSDTGGPVAAYGGPPDTGSADTGSGDGTVDDVGGGMPKYGAPPPP